MAEVLLARIQNGAGPFGMVGTVGIFLALQTYTDVLGIFHTVLTNDVGIFANTLEVTAIDLYARLVGEHLHEDACLGTVQRGTDLSIIALAILIGI
jgi:hypothetical protein